MAEIIRMPKMSDTMEEGVIAQWLKKEGETVKSGDILAEVETDKATMELESYWDGVLLHIGIKEGESVPVDGVIAIIGKKGEDVKALLSSESANVSSNDSKVEAPVAVSNSAEKIDVSGINATVVTMPKMSDTMEEGVIADWLKKEGDSVKSGDVLAEIETDKATMEFESYWDGVLLYIGAKSGDSIPVNGVLAVIGEKGADFQTLLKAHQNNASDATDSDLDQKPAVTVSSNDTKQEVTAVQNETVVVSSNGKDIKASPLARKMAKDLGYDIAQIKGSGDYGRIVKKDIESFTPSAVATAPSAAKATPQAVQLPSVVGEESYEEIKVSQMRKTIAKRLSESKFTAPHFYLTMEINMDKAIEARKSINEISPVKVSFNDLVLKATAAALRKHPDVNVSWLGDKLRKNHHINIGVAVAVPEGLIVPVVRFADNKSLSHISTEVKSLATKAANKELQPKDWEGSTFTISNLGMFGIDEFTAIINPPDACILAVGGIKQTPVVKDGQIVPGNVMKVTLSCDHRAVDGAVGAAFLQTLRNLLEDPVRIMI
ncbi:MAG: pyruvate dehydrogenase complex dihydrolipoamide acetyltransferase [Cyclobacteriaceae bacterium]|nr:pyruvate dehydrogenase complex dihydrolipoamide acetyltransferase [Cyclobacteriaceae bacterium]